MRRAYETGNGQGTIALYMTADEARDLAQLVGPSDRLYGELLAAAEYVDPPSEAAAEVRRGS